MINAYRLARCHSGKTLRPRLLDDCHRATGASLNGLGVDTNGKLETTSFRFICFGILSRIFDFLIFAFFDRLSFLVLWMTLRSRSRTGGQPDLDCGVISRDFHWIDIRLIVERRITKDVRAEDHKWLTTWLFLQGCRVQVSALQSNMSQMSQKSAQAADASQSPKTKNSAAKAAADSKCSDQII